MATLGSYFLWRLRYGLRLRGVDAVYCRPEVLTLDELARYRLPSPSFPNDLYREFFSRQDDFERAVRALETDEYVRRRPDQTYRIWDAYRVLAGLIFHSRILIPLAWPGRTIPAGSLLNTAAGWLRDIHIEFPEDEAWWEAVEAVNQGLGILWEARHLREVKDDVTGMVRAETGEEYRARMEPLLAAIEGEIRAIADTLPREEDYWKARLREHASLVMALREGFTSLARLCSWQLSGAVRLATLRLGRPRREIRSLVGRVFSDSTAPALTAASFSTADQAFDLALDQIEESLPEYNDAVPAMLWLSNTDAEEFLRFLHQAGLEHWYVELSGVWWPSDHLWESTHDQRIGVSYGGVRTLCALLEEALLAMADRTGEPHFRVDVESGTTLYGRLTRFVKGPNAQCGILNAGELHRLRAKFKRTPPFSGTELASSLTGLGMPAGKPAPATPRPSVEQVLAGLVFVRNLTSHRYPVVLSGTRGDWFETWGGHLTAINRTILWAALALWALTKQFYASGA